MWNAFIYENKGYVLKISYDNNYRIILTEFERSNLWIENLTKEQICQRCKELNPLIETNNQTYIDTVTTLLSCSNDEAKYMLSNRNDELVLEITSRVHEMNFMFQVMFRIADRKTFYDEIVVPLIKTVRFMKEKEDKLNEIIEKKDEEIKRHLYEHGEIEKKQLITEKFIKNEFMPAPSHLCCDLFSNEYFSFDDESEMVKKEKTESIVEKKRKSVSVGLKFMMKKRKK